MSNMSKRGLKRRKTRLLDIRDELSMRKLLFSELLDSLASARMRLDELILIVRRTPTVLKKAGSTETSKARRLIRALDKLSKDLDNAEALLYDVLCEASKMEASISEQIEEIDSMLKEV